MIITLTMCDLIRDYSKDKQTHLMTVWNEVLTTCLFRFFTSLHGMQTRSSDENSVCLSVCLSIKSVICDKTEESCAHILIPHERPFTLVFWQEEWLVGSTPLTWNFESNWPRCSEIADFQSIFARSASAVTPSKNAQLKLIGSPLRAL